MNSRRILIVEDEPALLKGLKDNFTRKGWVVETAADGESGADKALSGGHDVLLLDILLPKLSGYAICKEVREAGIDTHIIMLTAMTQTEHAIDGLNFGADDYVRKPFDIRELLARAEAALRRAPKLEEQYQFGEHKEFELDLAAHRLFRNGIEVVLKPREFDLLRYFVEHRGRVLTRDMILRDVWRCQVDPRSVDTSVTRLRAEIEKDRGDPKFIRTIKSRGYRFDDV